MGTPPLRIGETMPIEIDYLLMLQSVREACPAFVTDFFTLITNIADSPLPILAVAVIMWCVDKKAGYFIGFGYVVANAVTQVVKCACCINRPWIIDSRVAPAESALKGATGYSFPSGHTTLATGVYGGIAVAFRRYRWLVVVMVLLIALTAFSRNFLGFHTPKDVLVAFAIACLALFLGSKFFGYIERHPERDLVSAVVFIVIGIAAIAFVYLKSYPLEYAGDGSLLVDPDQMKVDCFRSIGAYLGFWVAWIIERRFIGYSVEGSVRTRVIRAIVGAALIAVIYLGILPVVTAPLGEHWGKFLKYFVLILCVGNLYPLCFMRFERRFNKDAPVKASE